ncbi:diguanylate cyclase/phosphodiesterase (GGDEF & EAL domains) with PAS/PAC sensor(s) [Dissulfuribacter thermophilus]|uniref:histidine kinase n=1 Tax=Dissulfuribacter thermophilus TaxID=1156395 RepID=A0A1B9F3H3_9BACT|nr:diguanylate cyclase/phosphodiesterase (GGDEF & EAL domains) with PAS/PAC sensor(s) [Dissulfuribacter thermophilus]
MSDEEMDLLQEIGSDVGFALHAIEEEEKRRQAEAEVRRARDELELKVAERTRELTEANARLKELDRLKSEFIATMSHELRTPLNSIIGFVGMILKGMSGKINEDQKKQLTVVYRSAKHLLMLINDILDVSRIESGKMEIVVDKIDIKDIVRQVEGTLSQAISQKGLRLIKDIPEEIPEVSSDPKRIFQILLNLVNNAVKFTDEGEIRITCRFDDSSLEIGVADTGIGIKKEDIDHIFEPFHQVDAGIRRKFEGSGLGLFLCKKLVTLLGGEIWAESEYGKGSKFTFTIPIENRK